MHLGASGPSWAWPSRCPILNLSPLPASLVPSLVPPSSTHGTARRAAHHHHHVPLCRGFYRSRRFGTLASITHPSEIPYSHLAIWTCDASSRRLRSARLRAPRLRRMQDGPP